MERGPPGRRDNVMTSEESRIELFPAVQMKLSSLSTRDVDGMQCKVRIRERSLLRSGVGGLGEGKDEGAKPKKRRETPVDISELR